MALHRRAIIANQKFIYKKEKAHLAGKLKYFQHRDDRDTHVKQHDEQGNPIRRWIDRGLGDSHGAIATTCEAFATTGLSNDVGARTLVLSPQVEFMQAIPTDRREAVMEELTEATVERWFEVMNLPTTEYAYVVHKGEVKTDRPHDIEQHDREFVHSHVVLAATVPGLTEARDNYKVYKEQLDQLHQVSTEAMEHIWTRELGAERVVELNQDLEDLTARLQAIDAAREQAAIEQAAPTSREIDEAMLDIYLETGIEPPTELLERIHDSREAELALDPLANLRALGFDIPEDEVDYLGELADMGFEIVHDPRQHELEGDIIELARELGFDIPQDTPVIGQETDDLLQAYRELGFVFPEDEPVLAHNQLDNLIDELRDMGFDIPEASTMNIDHPDDMDIDM